MKYFIWYDGEAHTLGDAYADAEEGNLAAAEALRKKGYNPPDPK